MSFAGVRISSLLMLTLRALLLLSFAPQIFAATTVVFNPAAPQVGPFPTDFLTIPDAMQKTGRRINLPLPSCDTEYSSCQETGLLEQFDGFSIRARAQAKFSAAINVDTLRGGMFYIALNNLTDDEPGIHKPGDVIAVDQVIFDPATNTAYVKPQSALDQHRRYAFVVTNAVQDSSGNPVTADPAYTACLQSPGDYCASLAQAVNGLPTLQNSIVAATVFTTMSATAWLEHARDALRETTPHAVTLAQGTFGLANLSGITLHEQTGSNHCNLPIFRCRSITPCSLDSAPLSSVRTSRRIFCKVIRPSARRPPVKAWTHRTK